MLQRLSPGKRNLALAIVGILILWFAWTIRSVLNPLLVGYLLAYIALPLVRRIEQHGFSRRSAVNLTFFLGFLVASAITFVLLLETRNLARDIMSAAPADVVAEAPPTPGEEPSPTLGERLARRYDATSAYLEDKVGIRLPEQDFEKIDFSLLSTRARAFLKDHREELTDEVVGAGAAGIKAAGGVLGFLSRFFTKLFEIGGWFFLVPLYAYYFLFELGRLHEFIRRYLPKRDRQQIADVVTKIGEVLANFFRGRLGVCFIKGLLISFGLLLVGVPYAFLFGMVSGFLSLIPFFGPFLGFAGCTLVGLAFAERIGGVLPTGDNVGFIEVLLRTGVVFGVCELIEGYVLIPKVLGDTLGLHPLVVLFAMFAGGSAFGVLGIVVALPVTASLVIVFREFVLPALREFADGDEDLIPG